jgi:hypothetical protein
LKAHLQKDLSILDDLIMFCHSLGANQYDIHFGKEAGITKFEISAPVPLDEHSIAKITELKEALALPRQHEIEQDYWELGGSSEGKTELSLIGMMLDEAGARYEDGVLRIRAARNEN